MGSSTNNEYGQSAAASVLYKQQGISNTYKSSFDLGKDATTIFS